MHLADRAGEQAGAFQGDQPVVVRAATSSSACSIRWRMSTAIVTMGRSSDRVSSRWVCRCWRDPNPSVPRSSTLVANWWRA